MNWRLTLKLTEVHRNIDNWIDKLRKAGYRIGPVLYSLLYRMALVGYTLGKGGRVPEKVRTCIITGTTLNQKD